MIDMQVLRQLMTEKFGEEHFEVMLQLIDTLHDAAITGELGQVSNLDKRTIIGWLDDIIFTAEETIRELQESPAPAPYPEQRSGN